MIADLRQARAVVGQDRAVSERIVTMGCRVYLPGVNAPLRGIGTAHWSRVVIGFCWVLLAGCVAARGGHLHAIDFHGAIVDGATGKPLPGIALVVTVGDRIVFDGVTDDDGVLSFACEVVHEHRRDLRTANSGEARDVVVTFKIQAGDQGGIEVPVRLGPGKRELSLGEIRLVQSGDS